MKNAVFLDSGIFIALLNRRDRWHDQACALFSLPNPQWATSVLVVSETYSWFLHRMGEEAARRFRSLLRDLAGLTVHRADEALLLDTWNVLDKLRGSKLTFVDAASLCLLKRYNIGKVWGTDHHLGITGIQVLPRGS